MLLFCADVSVLPFLLFTMLLILVFIICLIIVNPCGHHCCMKKIRRTLAIFQEPFWLLQVGNYIC
jgi:hypothetical protein